MSAEIPCISCTVACKTFFDMCELTKGISDDSSYHYSQIRNEMFQCNASKFAIFYVYENQHTFCLFIFHCVQLYFLLMNTIHKGKSKVASNEIRKKFILIFMYTKRITNFEVFHWNITLSARLLFLMTHMVKLSLMHFIK